MHHIGWLSLMLCVSLFPGHVEDAVFNYIRDRMLHSDPHLRPIASEMMSQRFMRYICTIVTHKELICITSLTPQ